MLPGGATIFSLPSSSNSGGLTLPPGTTTHSNSRCCPPFVSSSSSSSSPSGGCGCSWFKLPATAAAAGTFSETRPRCSTSSSTMSTDEAGSSPKPGMEVPAVADCNTAATPSSSSSSSRGGRGGGLAVTASLVEVAAVEAERCSLSGSSAEKSVRVTPARSSGDVAPLARCGARGGDGRCRDVTGGVVKDDCCGAAAAAGGS
ncbi:unnamed protein product [Ectocarpus fasciculatus]